MDGFYQFGEKNGQYEAYSYVKQSQLVPYWDMAEQYVLADAMFPTEFGGSFTGHLTLVAGTDDLRAAEPSRGGLPQRGVRRLRFAEWHDKLIYNPEQTLAVPARRSASMGGAVSRALPSGTRWQRDLDTNNVSWKYYATKLLQRRVCGSRSKQCSTYARGPDWYKDIIAPQTKILTDPGSGNLASVSWVSPQQTRLRSPWRT